MLLCVQFKNTRVLSVHSVAILVFFRTQSHLAREAHARAFAILVSPFSSTLDSGVNALYLICIVVFCKARASRASEKYIFLRFIGENQINSKS